jgi:hypothetical protein
MLAVVGRVAAMDRVSFDYAHTLSLAEAGVKVTKVAKALCDSFKMEMTKGKGRVGLSGKAFRGHVAIYRNKLNVSMSLVGVVTPTRASVEAGIRQALDKQFS